MDYYDAVRAICQPIRAADYPHSLESMRHLLKVLGSPEQTFASVVVAGSVGKGTLCHQIVGLLRDTIYGVRTDQGLHVGLYTSPHLHSFRERFVVNGRMISQADFIRGVMVVREAMQQIGARFSTFELATALGLWWFREQAVDVAVLEIGIGGRWDAVNTVSNSLAVITPIEMEHADMLGGTLDSISGHKAGIIQLDGYAISVQQAPEVTHVLQQEARQKAATLEFVPYDQLAQAATLNLMRQGLIAEITLPAGALDVHLPGRMEFVNFGSQQVLIDGAHTSLSAARLRKVIDRMSRHEPVLLIVGMLRDKSASELLILFDDEHFQIVLTQPPSHRALSATALHIVSRLTKAQVIVEPDLNRALQIAVESNVQRIVVTGSLRTAAAAREYFGLLNESEWVESRATRAIFEGEPYLNRL